jgi:hypothetical protein
VNRDINGTTISNSLLGVKVKIEWYKKDNSLDSNIKIIKSWFTREQAGEYLVKRRSRNINNLKGLAKNTTADSYIITIFDHYKEELNEYIETGADTFKNAIINETDQNIISILNIELLSSQLGVISTIKNILIYNIS